MRRHHITLGAKTTAGGTVVTASSAGTINGVALALEGDKIACPACKSEGSSHCVGPRIPETWNGLAAALELDLCLCGCEEPPKLMPAQFVRYQSLDSFGSSAEDSAGLLDARFSPESPKTAIHDEQFRLIDSLGCPLANVKYLIRTQSGREISGVTDAGGHTERVATSRAETLHLYLV